MKRIGKVLQYQLHETVRAVIIFYGVILLLVAAGFGFRMIVNGVEIGFDGMKLSTTVFLFVAGLNSFKSAYLFLQANGVTRRHFYAGGLISVVLAAAAMTVVDAGLYEVIRLFEPVEKEISPLLYPNIGYFAGLVWTLALNLVAVSAGWFLTMLYYNMNKGLKIAVSLSPAVLFTALPLLNNATGGRLLNALAAAFRALMGLAGMPNAYIGALSMAVFASAGFALCYLLVRRAPVKEQDR